MYRTVIIALLIGVQVSSASFLGWAEDEPCPGVCACTRRSTGLMEIDCSNRGLLSIPIDAKWPTNKTTELIINFEGNNIRSINGFPPINVVEMNFRKNGLSEITDGALKNLTSLRILDLSFNNLAGNALSKATFWGPDTVFSYSQLFIEKLDLTANKIHSLDKDVFDFVESLKEIILDENELLEMDAPTTMALASTSALETLSLVQTGLRHLPQGVFNSLLALKTLNLANNYFEQVPASIASARNLQELNLNGNPIQFLDEGSFVGLNSLITLNISAMPDLEAIKEKAFTPLKSLRVLRCMNNEELEDIHALAFQDIADSQATFPVRELLLADNALTTLSSALVPWDVLERLDIQGNPWNCDCYLKWMTVSLLDHLERMNPSLTYNIVCDTPPRMHGEVMAVAALDPEQFVCSGKSSRPRPAGRRGQAQQSQSDEERDAAGATIAVIMTGILLIVLSVGALMWMMHGKRRTGTTQVQYTRAPEDDGTVEA